MKQIYISLSLYFNTDDDFDINGDEFVEDNINISLKDVYFLDAIVEHMEEL